jgi:hypothetical protein
MVVIANALRLLSNLANSTSRSTGRQHPMYPQHADIARRERALLSR